MRYVMIALITTITLVISQLLFSPPNTRLLSGGPDSSPVWGTKPVLAHLLGNPAQISELSVELALNQAQSYALFEVVQFESQQIAQLERESLAVIQNPALSAEQKVHWVIQSHYNQRVRTVLQESQRRLTKDLGPITTLRLVDWIEKRWQQESQPGNSVNPLYKVLAKLFPAAAKTYPRSLEVYATRYEAGDRKIVALPDKCLKFANGGALQCDGYAFGQAYSVAIRYEDNLVVALVGESGPWNVDDNYWAKANDPQPRRMFTDLPLGIPEAQAAYFNGYNGGLDQFGRLVTSPVAIDISKALAADLGLPPGNNKVTVSFLWTEGWDASIAGQAADPAATAEGDGSPVLSPAITWQTATPNPDGSIVHEVQSGQTLVGIAAVYGISLADLLSQNGLTMQTIIQPGDQILVKKSEPTATITPLPTQALTPTQRLMRTRLVTPTVQALPTLTPQLSPTSPTPSATMPTRDNWILGTVILVGLAGIGLLVWGVISQRQR